jgi:hypothetical protein
MKNRYGFIILLIAVIVTLSCTCPATSIFAGNPTPTLPPPTATPLPPTATPEPTQPPPTEVPTVTQPEPTAAGQSNGDSVAITTYDSYSVDDIYYIFGEIYNANDFPVTQVELRIVLYDENDEQIAEEITYPYLNAILADSTAPFMLSSSEWKNASTYEVYVDNWSEAGINDLPPEGIEISNYTSYDDGDWFYVVGEIVNNSVWPISWILVPTSLYDENDQILDVEYGFAMMEYIDVGEKSPFMAIFSNNWQNASYYIIQVQADRDVMPEKAVELVSFKATYNQGTCSVSGTVKNVSSGEIEYANVAVSYYDADENLINAQWTFSNDDTIPAGGTSTFEVSTDYCPDFDHAEVQVQ